MQSFISSRIVVVFLLLFTIQASATQAKDFSGQWETTYSDQFSGSWRENGASVWMSLVGTRAKDLRKTFAGVWETSFGRMRLIADAGIKTAVSGYQNPVDWAASALFEMTYLDLLLSRGMNAPEASATALSMFPIAGKAPIKNVPILPGGFEILH
jgi:imidazolonepropionase-like amidohydrolase